MITTKELVEILRKDGIMINSWNITNYSRKGVLQQTKIGNSLAWKVEDLDYIKSQIKEYRSKHGN